MKVGSRLLCVSLAVALTVAGLAALNLERSNQAHLKWRLNSLARNAANAADALRILQQSSDADYERYRALFALRAFISEHYSLAQAVSGSRRGTPETGEHLPSMGDIDVIQSLIDGNADPGLFAAYSAIMADAERYLGDLNTKRRVSVAQVERILDRIEWSIRSGRQD